MLLLLVVLISLLMIFLGFKRLPRWALKWLEFRAAVLGRVSWFLLWMSSVFCSLPVPVNSSLWNEGKSTGIEPAYGYCSSLTCLFPWELVWLAVDSFWVALLFFLPPCSYWSPFGFTAFFSVCCCAVLSGLSCLVSSCLLCCCHGAGGTGSCSSAWEASVGTNKQATAAAKRWK